VRSGLIRIIVTCARSILNHCHWAMFSPISTCGFAMANLDSVTTFDPEPGDRATVSDPIWGP